MSRGEELPDGFSFEDFLAAIDEVDKADDADLPTDRDGCALLVTMPVVEVAAALAKLREAGLDPHTDVPSGEEIDRGATASIFVPHASLGRARAVLRLES
ncbi:MAG TPA: hypothetical protein VLA82_09900 [Actinomycetota bacterium]|nr:hypothetical protein [Actinomycetota bacterium]